MMHIALLIAGLQGVEPLRIAGRAQRGNRQDMCLAAHKETRTVHARHTAYLHADRANLRRGAAVGAYALFENAAARGLFEHRLKRIADIIGRCGAGCHAFGKGCLHIAANSIEPFVQRHLAQAGFEQFGDALLGQPRHFLGHFGRRQEEGDFRLRLAKFGLHGDNQIDYRLVGFMGQPQRLEHHVFGQFVGAGFHHQDIVARAGCHQVEAAVQHLVGRGIDDKLAVHKADRRGRNRAAPGDVADRERRRSSDDGQRIHQVLAVSGQRRDDHLCLIAHALGEERAQRAIHQA